MGENLQSNQSYLGLTEINVDQIPNSNVSDQTYTAWIPSKKTKDALDSFRTSGISSIDKSILTMPGVAIKEEFVSLIP